MFNKLITWLYQKQAIENRKVEIVKNLSKREQDTRKFYKHFQDLAKFVQWVNTKALTNKKQRKSFWKDVSQGHKLVDNILEQMIDRYDPDFLPQMVDLDTQVARAERKLKKITKLIEILKTKKKLNNEKK